jgi:hypothetical protein
MIPRVGSRVWAGTKQSGISNNSLQLFVFVVRRLPYTPNLINFLQADLDQDPVLRGRPIVLTRVDGHASWVSTRVLELIAPLPSAVPGGIIQRDAKGKPTGAPWSDRS